MIVLGCIKLTVFFTNLVAAVEWGKKHRLHTVALVGGKGGKLAELADLVIAIDSTHYGRVEDAHMGICHMICYAFMEQAVKMKDINKVSNH